MRNILRQKGLTRISIPVRTLGQTIQPGTSPVAQPEQKVDTVNATDDLMRQWATQTPQAPQKPRNEIVELRKECKQRGIKMARTDKIADLRAKLDGTHAS
jgi:phage shock protein A